MDNAAQTTAANPNINWEGEIGPATRRWVRERGSTEDKKRLEAYDEARLSPEQKTRRDEARRQLNEKIARAEAKETEPDEDKTLRAATARMFRTMNRRSAYGSADASIAYAAARKLIWNAYRELVLFETGREPVMAGRESLLTAMHQIAHWLVGQETESGRCDCEKPVELVPMRQSIYIYGPLGTGKSKLAEAAHFASRQLAGTYNTGMNLGYKSLDEMIVEVYTNQSLEPIKDATKGSMVLDELRTQHIGYKHFGNDVRILADILLLRHQSWTHQGAQTIITSNIDPAGLEKAINDERLTDRLAMQYYVMLVTGDSFRSLKNKQP